MNPLLVINDVSIYYSSAQKRDVCHNISLSLVEGECVGLIGESGCGKSTLLKSINGLIRDEGGIRKGGIFFQGQSLLDMNNKDYHTLRTSEMAMVFQDCMNALNPAKTIGKQLRELYIHRFSGSYDEAKEHAITALTSIGLNDVERIMRSYPYQLSGGMLQRIGCAMVMMVQPKLILADEPTSALDVVSAQHVLSILKEYVKTCHGTLIVTSHHMPVIYALCDRVLVMVNGYVVEEGATSDILASPLHPYTINLICAARLNDQAHCCQQHIEIDTHPQGCVFQGQCHLKTDICEHQQPPLIEGSSGRKVACYHVSTY